MASRRRSSKRNVGTRLTDIDSRLKRAERKFSPQTLGTSVVSSVNIVAGSVSPDSLDTALSGSLNDVISGNTEIGNSAESAFITAEQAANAAANAQLSADGKNTIYYQTAAPTGGTYRTNDIWFDTDDGYKMYVWNGTTWTASVFGNSALGTLDVGKLTAGTINASMQMTIGTVANSTSRVVIDGGGSGDAGIRLISRSAGGVDTTLVNLSATTGSATFAGTITASSGTIGGFTIGASSLSATNILLDNAAPTLRLGPTGAGAASVFYASSSNGLWLGHHTSTSAPFRVSLTGALTATSATVTGTINATAGYIGSTASNGWTINSDFLRSQGGLKQVTLDGTNARIYIASGTGTHATAGTDFYADATGLFSLRDKLIFNPGTTDSSGFATLTVIGKIRGAIDNVPIVLPNAGTWTVTQAVISGTSPNQTAVVTTSLTHDIAINDTVVIANVTGGAAVINGAWKVTNKTSLTFTIDGIAGATNGTYTGLSASGSTARVRELTIGLHPAQNGSPAGLGIRLDENNYWFINNAFKVGGTASYVSWNGTTLEVLGTIKANAGFIGGTTNGWSIGSTLLSNGNIGLFAPSTTTTTAVTSGPTTTTSMNLVSIGSVAIGMSASHANLPLGTVVTAVAGNNITLSNAPTSSIASGQTISFANFGFYAGVSHAARWTAPFRVDYSGNLVATSANITGRLAATSGAIGSWSVSTSATRDISADPLFGNVSGSFLENKTNPLDISSTSTYVSMFTGTGGILGSSQLDGFIAHRPAGYPFMTAYLGSAGLAVTSPELVNLVINGGMENFLAGTALLTGWNTTNLGTDYTTTLTSINLLTSTNPSYAVSSGQWGASLSWTSNNPSGYYSATIDGSALNSYYGNTNVSLSLNVDMFYNHTIVGRTISSVVITDTTITVTTSVAHGFSVGDCVLVDAVWMDDNGTEFSYSVWDIKTVPTTTTFTLRNNVAIDSGIEVLGSYTNLPGTGANPTVIRIFNGYMDLADVRIRFANNFTIPLYNVLTSDTQSNWADFRYYFHDSLPSSWTALAGFSQISPARNQATGYPQISLSALKTAAGANWDGVADFFIDFPAWLHRGVWNDDPTLGVNAGMALTTGPYTVTSATINVGGTTGTILLSADPNSGFTRYRVNQTITLSGLTGNAAVMNGLRTITAISGTTFTISGFTGGVAGTYAGQTGTLMSKLQTVSGITYRNVIDSVVLSLEGVFFAGDMGSAYSWYDPFATGTEAYQAASIKTARPYIDFSTLSFDPVSGSIGSSGTLSNLGQIYYKSYYDKPLYDTPYVGSRLERGFDYTVPIQWFSGIGLSGASILQTYSGDFRYKPTTNIVTDLATADKTWVSSAGTGWEATATVIDTDQTTFDATIKESSVGIISTRTASTFYTKVDSYSFKNAAGTLNFRTGYTYTNTSATSSNTTNVIRSVQDSGAISRSLTSGASGGNTGAYTTPSGGRYVAFTTPPSGVVLVHINARLDNSNASGRCYYTYEIRSGSSTGTVVVSSQFHNALYLIGTNASKFGLSVMHQLTGNTKYWIKETMEVYAAASTTNTATVDFRRIVVEPVY